MAEGPVIAIHQPDAVLAAMDDWNRTTHGESGLVERVRAEHAHGGRRRTRGLSSSCASTREAGASPMCGNSICQDRRFLAREMPELEKFFHYRNLDVSTLKELARRWAPDVLRRRAEVVDPSRARRYPRVDRGVAALPAVDVPKLGTSGRQVPAKSAS